MGRKFKFAKTELQYSGQNAKPKYMVIEFLPEQVGTLTYTGEELFPTWKNLDPLKLNIEGEISATNAGKHYITVTPTGIFAWPDMTQTPKQIEYIIERAVIDKVPTQRGTLTFNNTEQTPEWNDFDASKMVIGGVYQNQIHKGTYPATFTPDSNHCWADKTFDAKEVSWEIKVLELTKPALQTNSFTYTGSAITPTITNFNANFMSKSGDISATNKGNYTITIGLLFADDSQWAGGGTASFNLTWAITVLTLPKVTANSLTLTYNGTAQEPEWQNFDATYIEKSGSGATVNVQRDYQGNITPFYTYFNIKGQFAGNIEWIGGGTDEIEKQWTIQPLKIAIPTQNTADSYLPTFAGDMYCDNGVMDKAPSWTDTDFLNYVTVADKFDTSTCSGSGTTFTAKINLTLKNNSNTIWSNGSRDVYQKPITIKKKVVPLPTFKWDTLSDYDSFSYGDHKAKKIDELNMEMEFGIDEWTWTFNGNNFNYPSGFNEYSINIENKTASGLGTLNIGFTLAEGTKKCHIFTDTTSSSATKYFQVKIVSTKIPRPYRLGPSSVTVADATPQNLHIIIPQEMQDLGCGSLYPIYAPASCSQITFKDSAGWNIKGGHTVSWTIPAPYRSFMSFVDSGQGESAGGAQYVYVSFTVT